MGNELAKQMAHWKSMVRQLSTIIDLTTDGTFIFSNDTFQLLHVNQGALHILGYTRNELYKMTPVQLCPLYSESDFDEIVTPLLSGKTELIYFNTLMRHNDGYVIPVEIRMKSFEPRSDRPRLIATIRDTTERTGTEQNVKQFKHWEYTGILASGVAHDLSNFLSPLLIYGEILMDRYPKERKLLEEMVSSSKYAVAISQQLLSVANGTEPKHENLQLKPHLEELRKFINFVFPDDIKTEFQCEKEIPSVWGNATQLYGVLMNLCINARDAMPHGGTFTLKTYVKGMVHNHRPNSATI